MKHYSDQFRLWQNIKRRNSIEIKWIQLLNKRKIVIALFLVFAISGIISLMLFRFGEKDEVREKDTTWVDEIYELVEQHKNFSQESSPTPLSMYRFYIKEDGISELIYHTNNTSDIFVQAIENILNKLSWVLNSSENKELMDDVLESSTYLHVNFRLGVDFGAQNICDAYFILKNDLNQNFQGAVVIYSYTSGREEYSLRAVVM